MRRISQCRIGQLKTMASSVAMAMLVRAPCHCSALGPCLNHSLNVWASLPVTITASVVARPHTEGRTATAPRQQLGGETGALLPGKLLQQFIGAGNRQFAAFYEPFKRGKLCLKVLALLRNILTFGCARYFRRRSQCGEQGADRVGLDARVVGGFLCVGADAGKVFTDERDLRLVDIRTAKLVVPLVEGEAPLIQQDGERTFRNL